MHPPGIEIELAVTRDGAPERCVSCGKQLEINVATGKVCHKCNRRHEGAKKASSTRNENGPIYTPCPTVRLEHGFAILQMAYEGEALDRDER